MALVTVYNYKGYSIVKDEFINHGRYATLEYIKLRDLVAVKEDSLELDESLLDPEGRYIQKEGK